MKPPRLPTSPQFIEIFPMLRPLYVLGLIAALGGCTDQRPSAQTVGSGPTNSLQGFAGKGGGPRPALPHKKLETIVNRAFEFREPSLFEPTDSEKLVAVDVEFRDHRPGFDLDEVDILDGETGENLGSGPEIKFLNFDGTLNPEQSGFGLGKPIRVLLVYLVPKSLQSVKLDYWGDRITSRATPLTEEGLRYDERRLLPGVEFWPYPRSTHFGDVRLRGRWLLVTLGEGTAVADLGDWPPTIDHWDCGRLRGIEAAPHGGWVMLTRDGTSRDDARFKIWLHPAEKPGTSSPAAAVSGPGDDLRGIGVVGDNIFAHDGAHLYWFVDGRLERDDTLGKARGVPDELDTRYTHGTIELAAGRKLLLWDGDSYERVGGQWKKTWPLAINEPYEFMTVPWEDDGFYYLENRKVYRVKPGIERQRVMSEARNITGIGRPRPFASVHFNLGSGQSGTIGGQWLPDGGYGSTEVRQVSAKLGPSEFDGLYWSEATQHDYVVARSGIFTIPDSPRPKERWRPIAD
jgi:hypothetical protein